jgi:spermidine synthase
MTISESKWFHEINAQWPGQANSLQIQEVLHTETSKYQELMVFQSCNHGNVLTLDGVIQVTERDEFAYQEMMAHLPMAAHGNAKKVLI